jgi:membrane protease YdiL (CAAX protease family)
MGMQAVFLGPDGVRAGWRAAMYIALFIIFMSVVAGLVTLSHRGLLVPAGEMTASVLLVNEVIMASCAIAAALVMARIEGRRFGDYGMPWGGALRPRFWKGAVWGVAQITVLMLAIGALGGYSFGDWALGRGEAIEYALLWALLFLMVGMFEEFFFRGYLQFTVASGIGFWPAAILLSLGFGAVHLKNSGEGLAGVPDLMLIALFFCLTLRRTGDLWFAIGFHAAFDFGETYLYSVPDSGIVMPGHLSAASLHGADWLTGGSVGPEGSMLSLAVLLLTFVVFDRVYRPTRANQPPRE